MKPPTTRLLLCVIALIAATGANTRAERREYSLFGYEPAFEINDRLEIGARIYRFSIRDDRRTGPNGPRNSNPRVNYIGSLWGLDEIQDYIPRLYVQYAFTPYFGAGVSYDRLAAKTLDTPVKEKNWKPGDGDIQIRGPMLYLFARYPNMTRFTPFGELGWIYYYADFKVMDKWASLGPYHRFSVDNTHAYFLGLGLNTALTDRWHVNAYWRRTFEADVDVRVYFRKERLSRKGTFPMDSDVFGLGVSYLF